MHWALTRTDITDILYIVFTDGLRNNPLYVTSEEATNEESGPVYGVVNKQKRKKENITSSGNSEIDPVYSQVNTSKVQGLFFVYRLIIKKNYCKIACVFCWLLRSNSILQLLMIYIVGSVHLVYFLHKTYWCIMLWRKRKKKKNPKCCYPLTFRGV